MSTPLPGNRPVSRKTNRQIAEILQELGDMLLIQGENRFKVIAYHNAAETIANLGQDINTLHAAGELESIQGIGKAIAEKIDELLTTGRLAYHDELSQQVPPGVVAMMKVPDVGPKTALRLWQELGITSVEAMQAAAAAGQLRSLKGFGAKSEQKILKGIELLARRENDRTPIGRARPQALDIIVALRSAVPDGAIAKIEIAGSLRRWCETIGDVDLLVVSQEPEAVMAAFRRLPMATDVLLSGAGKTSIRLASGLQVDLRVVEARHWGAAYQYFTGSQQHNVTLREWAQRQGWSLNEYGLRARGHAEFPDGEERTFDTEAALYEFLGFAWIPPEIRENRGEFAVARIHSPHVILIPDLVTLADVQGELHGHTTWSDGKATIAEMAEAARRRGYRYWAVCDHSVGLGVTGGLDGKRLLEQADEIARLNQTYAEKEMDFRLLCGIEVEILADGNLGLPDELLSQLDVVVASIHSGQRQERETITARCLRAVHNPHVDILGHPTGRLLGQRAATELDVEQVLLAAAATNTIVEINANPARLDLNDVHARRAAELGCRIAVNSDAHDANGMDIMEFGIATARRAWLTAAHVVNTRSWPELSQTLKGSKTSAPTS